jgi:anti-sigma factor RsiW
VTGEHERIVEDLSAYVLESLEAEERAHVEAHVRTCTTCAGLVAEYRAVVGMIPAGLEPTTPPRYDPDLHEHQAGSAQARGVVLRGESDQDPDRIGRARVPCSRNIPMFLKHGAKKVNEIELVAPTGFEPVIESRPRFR